MTFHKDVLIGVEHRSAFVKRAKGVPCADCGGEYPYYVMQFDHVAERGPKLFNLSDRKYHTMQAIKEEVAKCDVVCANCHHIRTYIQNIEKVAPIPVVEDPEDATMLCGC